MSNIITMVDRASEILDYLYKSNEAVGVSKLSTNLELPKATVFRILTTLEKWNIVKKQHDSDKYKLGMVLIKYGAKVSANLSIVEIAKPIIYNFSKDIGESMNLSIEHEGYSLNVYHSSNNDFILASRFIPVSPLNCSASGKIFLSTKSEKELIDYFKSDNLSKRTTNSIVEYSTFKKEKDDILSTNLAYDHEEYEYGLLCISSPIFHRGKIVAVISISGPKSRLEFKGIEVLERKLKLACKTVSDLVGYLSKDSLF